MGICRAGQPGAPVSMGRSLHNRIAQEWRIPVQSDRGFRSKWTRLIRSLVARAGLAPCSLRLL